MNKVIFTGRLTRDLTPKNTKNGLLYVNFFLAVERSYKKGEEQTADFFKCTAFDRTAETMIKFLGKGSKILVDGHGQLDRFQDKNGVDREQFSVIVDRFEFLEKKQTSADPLESEFDGGTDMDVPF